MICPKCKTASSNDENRCPYCGKSFTNKKFLSTTLSILFLISILTVSGLYLYYKPDLTLEKTNTPAQTAKEEPTKTVENKPVVDKSISSNLLKPNLDNEELYNFISMVHERINKYYTDNSKDTNFISEKGFFYNFSQDKYVKASDIINPEDADSNFDLEKVLILYTNIKNINKYGEVAFEDNNKLSIVIGYETNLGVVLTDGIKNNLISKEDFNDFVKENSVDYGELIRPLPQKAFYTDVEKIVTSYEFTSDKIVIRYLAYDNKYGFVVVSSEEKPTELRAYALENVFNTYGIILSEVEKIKLYPSAINEKFPDFNLDLLPKYNINQINNYIQGQISQVLLAYKETYKIGTEEILKIKYVDAVDKYAYICLEDNKRYIGVLDDENNVWNFIYVDDYMSAEELAISASIDFPLFIIPQI